jgi:1-acyl-sn-glycerol-3-phosphate acyltransferase
MTVGTILRSTLFALVEIVTVPAFAVLALATFPFKPLTRYRVITLWSRLILRVAERLCGIRYRVLGADRIPRAPFIVLANHQSAWETLAFQEIFPPQVWVVKRELLWLPLFGWGLAMLTPIAIDRGSGAQALRQMLEQGRDRLAQGFCIVIFPEGTRVAPGERREFHAGGAWLAVQTAMPVVPVAHNAGGAWPRKAFLKYPGMVTVSVGEPIAPQDFTPQKLNHHVEQWIDAELRRIQAEEAGVSSKR